MNTKREKCSGPTHELCTAARRGSLAGVMNAVCKGAHVNVACACQGMTAMSLAAARNRVDMATVLVQNGADVNATHGHKQYPLHQACMTASFKMVCFLLEHGANSNQMDMYGGVALHYCPSAPFARRLLKAGAKVELDNGWVSPLHSAIHTGNLDLVRVLVDAGAEIERRAGGNGDTPLEFSEGGGRTEINCYLTSVLVARKLETTVEVDPTPMGKEQVRRF